MGHRDGRQSKQQPFSVAVEYKFHTVFDSNLSFLCRSEGYVVTFYLEVAPGSTWWHLHIFIF